MPGQFVAGAAVRYEAGRRQHPQQAVQGIELGGVARVDQQAIFFRIGLACKLGCSAQFVGGVEVKINPRHAMRTVLRREKTFA